MSAAATTAATRATRSTSLSSRVGAVLRSSDARWAVGGWALFVGENALLSENRTWLIRDVLGGEDNYRALYGAFSTAATGSIAYAYYRLARKNQSAALVVSPSAAASALKAVPVTRTLLAVSWTTMTLGLIMASQSLPKMQIPVSSSLQVRCPFDFSDREQRDDGSDYSASSLRGLERVTRHPGLWSLAFVGMGNACLQTGLPLRLWWLGPTAVAWLGGWHTDSRFRRGMGGSLDPAYDSVTSNVPFAAMLTGRQGSSPADSFRQLAGDVKPLNAGIAAAVATAWVASRGRIRLAR